MGTDQVLNAAGSEILPEPKQGRGTRAAQRDLLVVVLAVKSAAAAGLDLADRRPERLQLVTVS